MLSKNVNIKKCAHELVLFNEKKKNKKDSDEFSKANFGTFWHLLTTSIPKIQQISLEVLIFSQKPL